MRSSGRGIIRRWLVEGGSDSFWGWVEGLWRVFF